MLFINLLTSISIRTLLFFAHVYMSFNEVNFNLPRGRKKRATFQYGYLDYQRVWRLWLHDPCCTFHKFQNCDLMLFINLLTSISIRTLLFFAHVYMSFNEVNFNLPRGRKKRATFQYGYLDYQRVWRFWLHDPSCTIQKFQNCDLMLFINLLASISIQTILFFAHVYIFFISFNGILIC